MFLFVQNTSSSTQQVGFGTKFDIRVLSFIHKRWRNNSLLFANERYSRHSKTTALILFFFSSPGLLGALVVLGAPAAVPLPLVRVVLVVLVLGRGRGAGTVAVAVVVLFVGRAVAGRKKNNKSGV